MADRTDDRTTAARPRRGWDVAGRFAKSDTLNGAATSFLAGYARLVAATSRIVYEPRTVEETLDAYAPLIGTVWHGPAFLLPMVRPKDRAVDVLVSRHSDGELIGRVLVKLGCGIIRGSRAVDRGRVVEQGGVSGFMRMKAALAAGRTVVIPVDSTASVRQTVSLGPIALARASRRPIVPTGLAARRRLSVGSWDRASISLPFNLIACVCGEPIAVPADADDAVMEDKRRAVEDALNAATARAFEIVDGGRG